MHDPLMTATTNVNEQSQRTWDLVRASQTSMRTSNPIRRIVDQLNPSDANPEKPLLSLSIGDPTIFGNLRTHDAVIDAVDHALHSNHYNGYAHSAGYAEARRALAKHYSQESSGLWHLGEQVRFCT